MDSYLSLEKNLVQYIDAGFPILYIRTYEEEKADSFIVSAAGRREVLEWNGADGFVHFQTKIPFLPNQSLENTLVFLKNGKELDRKLLVIKDSARELESEKVISLLKEIARKIRKGDIDTTVVIVSSVLQIPKALESLITIMELSMPDEREIYSIIEKFLEQNEIGVVYQGLLEEMSIAFKGLSESEIKDLLRLAISSDGELTQKSLQFIFNQNPGNDSVKGKYR